MKITTQFKLTEAVCKKANIAPMFNAEDLATIGHTVVKGFEQDLESRSDWEQRYQAAMDLALQLSEGKNTPWANASNVKFPLVTIAAIQWHSRAYPALVNGPDLVKCRVKGPDPSGQKHDRAVRVGKHMSWQLLEEDPSWEEDTDRALIQLPIIGCVFKKSRRHSTENRNTSETVSARNFVLNYHAKSVDSCPRKTEIIPLHKNTILERMRLGAYVDYEGEAWLTGFAPNIKQDTGREDRRTGTTAPQADEHTPFEVLEQHVLMDLDQDGYAEPYIITVALTSKKVLRIVTGFEWEHVHFVGRKIAYITQLQYYTKYSFIPSPDNGIYDMGFGALLGPLNASVDTIINQLIDAGTLSTCAGGFIGKGLRIRGGDYTVNPFQWNRVDSPGDDITKNLVPFTVREPSNVLFQLLGLLIDYTNRISGSTDIMVGENPGQNTPAQTSQLMAEQGAKISTAIFKRVWRGMKAEFGKLHGLNKLYAEDADFGEGDWVKAEDYQGSSEDIRPAADPNLSSDNARIQLAGAVAQRAQAVAGYDRTKVELNLLRAMKVENIEELFPGPEKQPAPPPLKLLLEQMKDKRELGKVQIRIQEKMLELAAGREKNLAEIELIKAQILEIISSVGAAQGARQIEIFETALKASQRQDDHLVSQMQVFKLLSEKANEQGQQSSGASGGAGVLGMATPPGNPGSAGSPGATGGAG